MKGREAGPGVGPVRARLSPQNPIYMVELWHVVPASYNEAMGWRGVCAVTATPRGPVHSNLI